MGLQLGQHWPKGREQGDAMPQCRQGPRAIKRHPVGAAPDIGRIIDDNDVHELRPGRITS